MRVANKEVWPGKNKLICLFGKCSSVIAFNSVVFLCACFVPELSSKNFSIKIIKPFVRISEPM